MRRLALAVVGLPLAFCGSATAAPTAIAQIPYPTPVRYFDGIAVLTVLDGVTGFRLATQSGNDAPKVLRGIASSVAPLDADIGPGPDGAPVIVFARCHAVGRCRLARTTPAGHTEIAITGSEGTRGFENAPTVWRGRLAFARQYAKGSEIVYTRPLDAGVEVASTRLPGLPARECDEASECPRIRHGYVTELELRNNTLAENVWFPMRSDGLCGGGQIRLVDAIRKTVRTVVQATCGLAGQTLLGPSLTAKSLLYTRVCPGDPGGCEHTWGIIFRYDLHNRTIKESLEDDELTGFSAIDDTSALELRAPDTEEDGGQCDNPLQGTFPSCELVRDRQLVFTAT